MSSQTIPDCHNYPTVDTEFETMKQFQQFRKFFCHLRNCTFLAYNNSASAVYLCPNYKKCQGVLHGVRNKVPARKDGNLVYNKSGYLKYETLSHMTIGPLTNPCNCTPDWKTSTDNFPDIFNRMLETPNISRSEFTNLANSYFAVAGKDTFCVKDTGYIVTWTCVLCKTGCLQMSMNRKITTKPSKYQSYGKITIATPCTRNCPSHTLSLTKKTTWLPKSNKPDDMALTPEDIKQKKQQNDIWVSEARVIAQEILKNQQIHKKSWKFKYLSEEEIRQQIEDRNAKISLSSKNRNSLYNKNCTQANPRNNIQKRKTPSNKTTHQSSKARNVKQQKYI